MRKLPLIILLLSLIGPQASAEIIEIDGNEIIDGEIISRDAHKMTFKDSYGNSRDLELGRVKVLDETKKTPMDHLKKVQASAARALNKVTGKADNAKRAIDKKTRKLREPLNTQPVKSKSVYESVGESYRQSTVSAVRRGKRVRKQLEEAGYGGKSAGSKRFKEFDL